jgi:hypothetical protein
MDQDLLDQCTEVAGRSYIPEDSGRDLFLKLYDLLVFASPHDRYAAVRMLVAAYDLPDVS